MNDILIVNAELVSEGRRWHADDVPIENRQHLRKWRANLAPR